MRSSALLLVIGIVIALLPGTGAAAAQRKPAPADDVWPLDLGTLSSVPARYPAEDGSVGAARLKRLAADVGVDFDAGARGPSPAMNRRIVSYVEAQIVRVDDRVQRPPREVEDFFRSHERRLDEIRELLLSSPIAWPLHIDRTNHAPLPNLRAHMAVTRLLVARALADAKWEDLHAATALQRGLWQRPEMISQLVLLSSLRMIVGAARNLPQPAPPWFQEVMQFDARRAMLASLQYEAWNLQREVESEGDDPGSVRDQLQEIVMKPFDEIFAGNYLSLMRSAAAELAASRQCAFDGIAFDRHVRSEIPFWNLIAHTSTPSFGRIWQRVSRFTAEREATANVLALKEGRAPRLASVCSDGSWRVTADQAGAKHLRFSREIPVGRPQIAIPLEYTVAK
jgi:hypothetical protein